MKDPRRPMVPMGSLGCPQKEAVRFVQKTADWSRRLEEQQSACRRDACLVLCREICLVEQVSASFVPLSWSCQFLDRALGRKQRTVGS